MAGERGGVRDCAGETRGSGRTKPYRGIRRVEGCPSVLRKSKVLIFIEEKGFVRDGKACGERYVSILCPGKDSVFFRPPIFLLELHSPSRSKDTSSVSLTLDTFSSQRKACGERYVSILCPGKDSVFFRPPIFLLELHSLSRNKDTSSVSLTLDTFTPESRALWVLSPSGTLGVQAPLRGRLAKCDALLLFLAARVPLRPPPAAPRVRPRAASLIPRRPASRSDH